MDPRRVGPREVLPPASRYQLLAKIAAGGMATVYVGRSNAKRGVSRLFAIKRAHVHLADDAVFRRMFVAEAQLAARIHHPNVVAVQDVEELDDELLLVMDYVEGTALVNLRPLAPGGRERARLASRILLDACAGLHAAHELADEAGKPLGIVHRDVSPQNILVGLDGITRISDFGIAKSTSGATPSTITGALKGKVGYMAPEYVTSGTIDRRLDVFAMGVVLWEALTGERLYRTTSEAELVAAVAACAIEPPTAVDGTIPAPLEAVVLRALQKAPEARFATIRELSEALETAARDADLLGTHAEVATAVLAVAGRDLERRRAIISERSLSASERGEPSHASAASVASEPSIDLGPEPTRTRTLDVPLSERTADGSGTLSVPPREAGPRPRSRGREILLGAIVIAAFAGVGLVVAAKSGPPSERVLTRPGVSSVGSLTTANAPASSEPASSPSTAAATPSSRTGRAPSPIAATSGSSGSLHASAQGARPGSSGGRPRSPLEASAKTEIAPPKEGLVSTPEPSPPVSATGRPGRAPPNPYRRDDAP